MLTGTLIVAHLRSSTGQKILPRKAKSATPPVGWVYPAVVALAKSSGTQGFNIADDKALYDVLTNHDVAPGKPADKASIEAAGVWMVVQWGTSRVS